MSSLTLNMVGGGGGLAATDALLRVQAPAQSTVTITKGSVTKIDAGHENADDPTVYDYYFIIHQSQFDSVNPWTVTATDGTYTATDTVVIDAADEYDVIMSYELYLYNTGTYTSAYSHESRTSNATVTDNSSYIQVNQTGDNYYGYIRWANVDLTNYSQIVFIGQAYDSGSSANGVYCYIFATQNSSVTLGKNATVKAHNDAKGSSYQSFTLTIDVSSLTGNWYVAAGHDSEGSSWGGQRKCRITSVQLKI